MTTHQRSSHSDLINQILSDPNYPSITSFIQQFGNQIGISFISFNELEQNLVETSTVPPLISVLLTRLLRRIYKSIPANKWEKSLIRFANYHDSRDGKELEKLGWRKIKLSTKLKILKNLLEAQFDWNAKFKQELNHKNGFELRDRESMGEDRLGRRYYFNSDSCGGVRLWREDEERIQLVAVDAEGVRAVIQELERGGHMKMEEGEGEGSESDEGQVIQNAACLVQSHLETPSSPDTILGTPFEVSETPCPVKEEIRDTPCVEERTQGPPCTAEKEVALETPCTHGTPRTSDEEVTVETPCTAEKEVTILKHPVPLRCC